MHFSARVPANALKRLGAGGFVPAEGLAGVEVSGGGLGGGKPAAHEQMVKNFWTTYFDATRSKVGLMQRNAL